MISTLLPLLANLSSGYKDIECPDGTTVKNKRLDFVHIHPFVTKLAGEEIRENVSDSLAGIVDDLNELFDHNAEFSIIRTIDKHLHGVPIEYATCHDVMANKQSAYNRELQAAITNIKKEDLYLPEQKLHTRPDILDPAIDEINRWAAEPAPLDADGNPMETIRVLSFTTNQCPKVQGRYRANEGQDMEQWKLKTPEGRRFSIPLDGEQFGGSGDQGHDMNFGDDVLATCHVRDYPSIREVFSEAKRLNVGVMFNVAPEAKQCEGSSVYYGQGWIYEDMMMVSEYYDKFAQDTLIDVEADYIMNTNINPNWDNLHSSVVDGIIDLICATTTTTTTTTAAPVPDTTTAQPDTTTATMSIDVPMTNPTQGPGLQIYCDNPAFWCSEYTDLPVKCLDKTTYINCSNTCATYAPDEFLNDKDIIDMITEADFCYPTDPTPIVTDAPVVPTDAPIVPTDAPIVPTDAPIVPTDAPIVPTDAPIVPTEDLGIDNGMITADLPSCECDCDGDCDCDSACDCQKEVVDGAADIAIVGIDQMADTINHVIEFIAVQAASEHEAKMNEGFTE